MDVIAYTMKSADIHLTQQLAADFPLATSRLEQWPPDE